VRIKPNETVDQLTKNVSLTNVFLNNNITYKEIMFSLRDEYSDIDEFYRLS